MGKRIILLSLLLLGCAKEPKMSKEVKECVEFTYILFKMFGGNVSYDFFLKHTDARRACELHVTRYHERYEEKLSK